MKIDNEDSLFTFNDTIRKPLKHFDEFRQDAIKKVIEHVAIEKRLPCSTRILKTDFSQTYKNLS